MKTKKFRGFTLVECLVALAVLGIGALVMAQIYSNVSRINMSNHNINTSLAYQMKIVEEATGADSVTMYFGGGATSTPDANAADSSTTKYPPHKQGIASTDLTKPYVKITGSYNSNVYSYPTDIYVLLSRDVNDKASDDSAYVGDAEGNYALRYKYIVGHSN